MHFDTEKKNYTYMLKCHDGTIYTGWTTQLDRRISEHNSGRGAKYTRSRRPVELIYYEELESKEKAMKREAEIKKMTKKQKIAMVEKSKKTIDKS